jgi:hypothetical protein
MAMITGTVCTRASPLLHWMPERDRRHAMKSLSDHDKASRIATIIETILPHIPKNQAVYEEILEVARREDQWARARAIFDRVRTDITLKLAQPPPPLDRLLAEVAEKACKVLCNGASSSARFDASSYVLLLRRISEFIDGLDEVSRRQAVRALTGLLPVSDA